MDIPALPLIVDMNDPWTLSAYKQMLLFQYNSGKPSLVFENPTHAQQDVLQSLAHRPDLGLEYEYNLVNRQACISNPVSVEENHQQGSLPDPYLQDPIILDTLDIASHQSNSEPMSSFGRDESISFDEDMFLQGFSTNSTFASDNNSGSLFSDVVVAPEQSLLQEYLRDHPMVTTLTKDQSNSIETVLLRDTPQNAYIPPTRPTGRTYSVTSQDQGRVGKVFSRVSSSKSTTESMFSCFDSKSIQSGMTDTSACSRRSRGAMDSVAIAAMNAVKVIGACWRCKLLRKQCDNHPRCDECPKRSSKSDWRLLGCRRGMVENNVLPVLLCPSVPGDVPESSNAIDSDAAVRINQVLQLRNAKRDNHIKPENSAVLIGSLDTFLEAVDTALSDANSRPISYATSIRNQFFAALHPLDECVKSIIWELSSLPPLQKILGGVTIDSLTVLLRSASLHQSKTEDNRLVAQSLICLRESLEVLALQNGKNLDGFSHLCCTRTPDNRFCRITSMASLESNISQYIKEFSRVLFAKARMRNVKSCWLSVFYSLCIQNFVRKALLRFRSEVKIGEESQESYIAAYQYLHVALRLFLAYSRKYDPLMQYSKEGNGSVGAELNEVRGNEVVIARLAVRHEGWASTGIGSSKAYLKVLFEDEGHRLY